LPRRNDVMKDLAIQRIRLLYRYAIIEVKKGNIDLARRYVYLMKRIVSKAKTRMPRRIKRSICKNCMTPLIPGVTARVRLQSEGRGSRIVVTCLLCGWIHRYPYKLRKKGSSRKEPEG